MNVSIFSQHFTVTQGLSSHIERSLSFALDHVADAVDSVSVRLSDSNSMKDKCCKIIVTLVGQSQVFIEESFSDLYAAIDKAVKRLKRVVGKQISRQKHFKKERIDWISSQANVSQEVDEPSKEMRG